MIDRRGMLKGIAAAAIVTPGLLHTHCASGSERPIANTRWGPVRGVSEDGTLVFKGVRYGADTRGANRFLPPRPPVPWTTAVDAVAYGPAAPQTEPGTAASGRLPEGESEDCLTLNVWTPGLRDGKKRPVMVWLHGGGLWRLSASGEEQAGKALSRKGDVVVVSPNHRLGVFGFLLLDDPSFERSAHAGMLDLVQALAWVRDNVEAFGGDPGNVTLFGQSGGGQKISFLMAMPSARGLFHKAAIQSGPAPLGLEHGYARSLADRLLSHLKIGRDSLRRLQQISTEQILAAYYKVFAQIGGFGVLGVIQDFAPVVDGDVLPQHPFWHAAPAPSADVPLLIGTTRTEMTETLLASQPDAYKMGYAQIETKLSELFGNDAANILAHYRRAHPQASPWEVYSLVLADWPTRAFSVHIAEAKVRQGKAPVFVYRMDWQTTVRDGLLMSPHAIDIPFVMDTVGVIANEARQEEHRRMADQMSAAWLAFAKSGRPRVPGIADWPAYDLATRQTLLFNLDSRVVSDPDGEDLRVLRRNVGAYRVVAGGVTTKR
jgi:para-nitrobenzyl esterase